MPQSKPLLIQSTVCFSCRQNDHDVCLCSWTTFKGQRIVCVCWCQYRSPQQKKGG